MKESGKNEEETISSFNMNEIIEQYNSGDKNDCEYESTLSAYKKEIKFYVLSIIISSLVTLLFISAWIIYQAIKFGKITLDDYGMAMTKLLAFSLGYAAYLRINEIYFNVKIYKKREDADKPIDFSIFLLFFVWFALVTALEILIFFLLVAENYILMTLITSAIILPFIVYFIIKGAKIKKSKK
ncbi:MAG: hypothetical protein J6Y42_03315 [Bacilli bacterium]|nr:hypothetical protein [Bacilli bacterium]